MTLNAPEGARRSGETPPERRAAPARSSRRQLTVSVTPSSRGDPRLAGHHRVHAVRAHLLQAAGRLAEATAEYRTAGRRTLSTPEQQYLMR